MKALILVAIIAGFVYFMYDKADLIKSKTTEPLSQKYQDSVERRMTTKALELDYVKDQNASKEDNATKEENTTIENNATIEALTPNIQNASSENKDENITGENNGREDNSTIKDDNISGL